MNVLLINPKFPVSFWSLEKSCRDDGRRALAPSLGLITVAALLPQEWDLRLVDVNARNVSEAEWDWADTVMITGMLLQKESLLHHVRLAKERGKTVVVGGPYATSVPGEVLDAGVDFLVRGEGETTIPLLLKALEEGRTGGVFAHEAKPDLTSSPIPRFDLLHLPDYRVLSIQTSRGCPFDCEFCDVVSLYGRKTRYKTPEQVIRELEAIYQLGWTQFVFVGDDNFVGSRQHARAILEKLIPWHKSKGEPFIFWTQASVNLGQDLEMVDLMTAANFTTVFIGIESPDEEVLTLTRKHHNVRNPLAESLENINRNGLQAMVSFVIGLDGEKKGVGERICDFVEDAGIPLVILNRLQALPNTSLWDRLAKEGRLVLNRTSGDTFGDRLNYVPTRPEADIMQEYVDAWEYLYEPSRFLARTYRYFMTMRPTRRAMALEKGEEPADAAPTPGLRPPRSLVNLLRLMWGQGVVSRHRFQFWRQFWAVLRRNPSRFVAYIIACKLCMDISYFVRDLCNKIRTEHADTLLTK
jgi:radical SAM superfamily enzyme YgiQ (UPF0313 family)